MEPKRYTVREWQQEAVKRFGPDGMKWAFKCPRCGHVQTVEDFDRRNIVLDRAYLDCIGHFTGAGQFEEGRPGPCDYSLHKMTTTDGLLSTSRYVNQTNTIVIDTDGTEIPVLDFAAPDDQAETGEAAQ